MEPIFHHLDQIFQVEAPQALGLLPVLAGLFGKHLGKPLGVRRQQAAFGDHHRHLAALEQVEVLVVLDQAVDLIKRNVGTVFHVHAACVDPAADRALGPAPLHDDALWQACRRNANLKNAAWMHSITVLDPDVCNKWDFQSLFVRMAQSLELPAQMRDIVFEAQVSEMMLLITLATGSGQTTAPSSTNVLVQRAVSYLQAHYQDPTLTTVKLAQELYASREHLSRAFKECTMESIHSYLTHLRMQHCRKALEDGVSVLNACTESGFPDYSSFLKTFRRLYGITPAEYRSQNRKKV